MVQHLSKPGAKEAPLLKAGHPPAGEAAPHRQTPFRAFCSLLFSTASSSSTSSCSSTTPHPLLLHASVSLPNTRGDSLRRLWSCSLRPMRGCTDLGHMLRCTGLGAWPQNRKERNVFPRAACDAKYRRAKTCASQNQRLLSLRVI